MQLPADWKIVPVDHLADDDTDGQLDFISDHEDRVLYVLASSRFPLGRIIEEAFRPERVTGGRLADMCPPL